MVRDNLDRTVVQSRKQNHTADSQNQSQPPEEPVGPKRAQSPERVQPESQEETGRQLDLLCWKKLNLQKDPETWCQGVPCLSPDVSWDRLQPPRDPQEDEALFSGADVESLPTHLRPFSSAAEYRLVKRTYQQLQHSGYYWGSMTMEEAHEILTQAPLGTFLIRDSGQPDVFFTLSYQSDEGPTSVRVQLNNLLFSLYGSHRTFASLFALLTYYTSSSCKLTVPYRKQRPERLKQMCRRALIHAHGAESISTLPGLSTQVKDYVHAYPCCI
ncbi:suppressor of cytokine signaling 1-like isoform X1 [Epinephelus lanceolatus]|uniref:suppressor of cytokine signaling 1-like isoform X1 n=1 Tax=Epinephelus lanceolatus TaxID=310571 RepID=UPI001445D4D2|nr:suppressor of cytokine signaling 1-like isoform X1 [Epinephelus lanceolatus]